MGGRGGEREERVGWGNERWGGGGRRSVKREKVKVKILTPYTDHISIPAPPDDLLEGI